ncbi:YiiQ family protein [Erwinia persicina]|uniref:YiiQ family protein n=1 Tax=Erwinia persicina TaxID=55211 RepID=UPI00210629F2|nr:YiiQ family protein [Erwinia persicina]MCQ4105716.1 YiiQ family protein [Erwinia persicina]UTX12808.1 YiiQ family protein [Erwinia persicina]
MKNAIWAGMALLSAMIFPAAHASPDPQNRTEHLPAAPYLQAGAPTFDMTIGQFREKYNAANTTLPLSEYRAIDSRDDKSNLTRAASKINENLYSSTALEQVTGKIKTLQITWLPIPGPEQKPSRDKAVAYIAALIRFFEPMLSDEQSMKRAEELLAKGKGSRFYQQTEGALRYIVADNGDKGLTFAVEPLKLALSNP